MNSEPALTDPLKAEVSSDSPVPSAMPLLDRRSGLSALDRTASSRRLRQLTVLSASLCIVALVALIILPWQQG